MIHKLYHIFNYTQCIKKKKTKVKTSLNLKNQKTQIIL